MTSTHHHIGEELALVDSLRLGSFFDQAVIGLALLDSRSRRPLRVNDAFARMLGYSQAQLLALAVDGATHPDDAADDQARCTQLLAASGGSYACERRLLHKDGHLVWAEVHCTLLRDAPGAPPVLLIQAQDIGPRRNAELALRRSQQQLHDSEAMLHMAAQIGRLGAWGYDAGDSSVAWSHEVCAIHDVLQGFRPTPKAVLAFFTPDFRPAMLATIRACMREGSPFDVEAQVMTARGRRIWVRIIGEAE
ncbi:MAG TPA: PAS domain-containing protein, partial [Ramlibacter sp.]|nr:PAS domain-containing protein [Ramlibacter sp.]